MRFIALFLFLLYSCSNPPYRGSDVCGAEEFVMDSYRIREGKFCVLQMEGKDFNALESDLLDEYKDVIHEGDVLNIAIYHPTRADLTAAVQQINQNLGFRVIDGTVHLPDLEPVHVVGLSINEAKEEIQKRYRAQIKDIEV